MLVTMKRTDEAIKRKIEIGKESDAASTKYEISKALGWTTGKTQGSLNRLKTRFGDNLTIEEVVENRRLKVKYDLRE
jgi:hypothetical protein